MNLTTSRKAPGEKRHPAFTLIELLIVVAIIAILAAIAVPNFIQAQVRAKVSRVLSDLRVMRTAVEAYAVDNVSYPRMTWEPDYGDNLIYGPICEPLHGTLAPGPAKDCGGAVDPRGIGGPVTTPIAYITTLPTDPFVSTPTGATASLDALLFTYWYSKNYRSGLNPSLSGGGVAWTPSPAGVNFFDLELGQYVLWSIGPEGEMGFQAQGRCFFLPYDPTNGSISPGSIFVSQKLNAPGWVNYIALTAGASC